MTRLESVGWVGLCLSLILGPWSIQAAIGTATNDLEAVSPNDPFAAFDAAPKPIVAAPAPVTEVNEPVPELFLESVVLKFLDATSLQSVLARMAAPYGSVAVNKSNNSVVLCDSRENLTKMLEEIRRADRAPQQIMVEVVILDIQLTNDTEIGVNWDLLSDQRYHLGYRQNFTGSRLSAVPEGDGTTEGTVNTIGNATAFNSIGTGGDISIVTGTVRNVLHLIQEKRNVDILASPRTLVVSGQSATIKAVEQIPYQQVSDTAAGGQGAITSTEFKDVGVTLEVTATVADGNDILLKVAATQSVQTGTSQDGVPVVDERNAHTSLLLRDGQMVVIGGLRREEKSQQVKQVPLLGDLPLVGFLFKNTVTLTTKSELAVLLSPHLDRGEPAPTSATRRCEGIRRDDWLLNQQEKKLDSPAEGG
jgi:type II secretory pathway component GspD/PulD (secretin)